MSLSSRLLRIPKPRKFLFSLPLSTGASLITLSLLLNKLSGLYGILALLTGFHLSPFQLSMYIYSIAALVLTAYLSPHIKTQSPLYCLALAWFYVLDSVINAAYTTAFAVTWFLVLLQHKAGNDPSAKGPGAGTIDDTAGFTSPQLNVSGVEVVATPQVDKFGTGTGQDAVAAGIPADKPAGTDVAASAGDVVLSTESINSIGIIIVLWTIRLYFIVVILSWARMVLRQHIAKMQARNPNTDFTAASLDKGMLENPFELGKPEGHGWQGKLGRFMVGLGQRYWLGTVNGEDLSWMEAVGSKFGQQSRRQNSSAGAHQTTGGVVLGKINVNSERESRRRSGTGPPLPEVQAAAGVISDEAESEGAKLLQVPQ